MNRGKWIILGGVAALVAATLYAPFTVGSGPTSTAEFRYGFLFDPPLPDVSRTHDRLVAQEELASYLYLLVHAEDAVILEVAILLAEWVAIVLVTGALYFVFRERREAV